MPRYDTRPSGDPVTGASGSDAIMLGVQDAAAQNGVALQGDGRLAQLAGWTAEHLREGAEPPAHDVVQFFAHHLGLAEPVPHLLILGQPDPSSLRASIADSVSQFLTRQTYRFFGGTLVERDGLTIAVVALSTRFFDFDAPIPRKVEAGRPIVVRGRLREGYSRPVFAIAVPSGGVTRTPAGDGPAFQMDVPTGEPGEYGIEVLARGPQGDTVVANFPVYAGVDIPSSITLESEESSDGTEGSASEVADALFRLMQETRREHALPPLELHTGLAGVALSHSQDMIDHDFVGHTSPRTGSAPDRVERAGYRSGLVLENIGRGYGAREIHRGLLASPGHRANILNPDVTHVGIGVAEEAEGARHAYVATEVFIRMAREIDVGRSPQRLLTLINNARRARGAPALESEQNLARAANDAALRYFAEPSLQQQEVIEDASASLRSFGIAFRRVGGVMAVVSSIEEASRLEPVLARDVRMVGIGVAQGNRPDAPPNSIAVVYILGWPR